MILCEKPLALNRAEAREDGGGGREGRRAEHGLVQLPPRAGGDARQADSSTRAGSARSSITAPSFLQDWTISKDLPQGGAGLWRLDVNVGRQRRDRRPARALHRHGDVAERRHRHGHAMTETFIKERKHNLTGKVEKVGIDDACAFLARFGNGSLATFESTRYARGHKALYTLEINGEHASIFWDLHDLHRLQYFDHRDEGQAARLALASTSPTATIPT